MNKNWYLQFIRTIDTAPEAGGSEDNTDNAAQDENSDNEKPEDEKLGEAGLKALRAEREAAKALKSERDALAAKIKEFEDKDKTEAEKTAERLAELEKASTTNATKALRLEIALDKGLPKTLAARLQGSSREELEADADALLKLIPAGSKTPKPDPSAGNGGTPKPKNMSDAIASFYANH